MDSGVNITTASDSKEITDRIKLEFAEYINNKKLMVPEAQVIRIGKAGGLPFESLSSDIMQGCLPPNKICFGSCFAAKSAFQNGISFGTRVQNLLDEEQVKQDLAKLNPNQGYIRNGWNSDPSWNWKLAARLATLIRDEGKRLPIFITKMFKSPSLELIQRLTYINAEVRVSISAFDPDSDIEKKLRFLDVFRKSGGVGIPIVMSTVFVKKSLNQKQSSLVDFLDSNDYPIAENSLRFPRNSSMLPMIDISRASLEEHGDYWCGRIFSENIVQIPTTTSVPNHYSGLGSGYMSRICKSYLKTLWVDPVPTNRQVLSQTSFRKPIKCGVAAKW
ncbi:MULTISPECIES: hypothetical protein [Pseudoalteromonas]|uniref:hypothetical protein n=1 Tax=Pseudoalteromonas TaxID=53246 RepID=UPI0030C996FB